MKYFKRFFVIAGLFVVALLAWRLSLGDSQNGAPGKTSSKKNAVGNTSPAQSSGNDVLTEELRSAAKDLTGAPNAADQNRTLLVLRQSLALNSTNEASAGIRRFLDSKIDAPTGQGFKIGTHGFLTEAPTLRTFLLDYLGQIDRVAAAEYARVILSSKNSPDEWAVALRNLALGDTTPDGHNLLEEKTGELLDSKDWQQNPSMGYLEAFDTAVYLGGTKLLPPLSELVSLKDNPAVAHAAFLTLDRLVINQPAEMLTALSEHSDWMTGREETRANYFARADVSDSEQRRVVEFYLLDAHHTQAELQAFAGIFPNANFMISPNLLTQSPSLDQSVIKKRDAESLTIVQQWLGDPRFAKVRPELEKIQIRLQEFVRQANLQP